MRRARKIYVLCGEKSGYKVLTSRMEGRREERARKKRLRERNTKKVTQTSNQTTKERDMFTQRQENNFDIKVPGLAKEKKKKNFEICSDFGKQIRSIIFRHCFRIYEVTLHL